jgi:hypothetical protein
MGEGAIEVQCRVLLLSLWKSAAEVLVFCLAHFFACSSCVCGLLVHFSCERPPSWRLAHQVASQEPPRKLISHPSSLSHLLPDLSELQICGHTCPNTQQKSVCLLGVNMNIIIIFVGDIDTKVHSEVLLVIVELVCSHMSWVCRGCIWNWCCIHRRRMHVLLWILVDHIARAAAPERMLYYFNCFSALNQSLHSTDSTSRESQRPRLTGLIPGRSRFSHIAKVFFE